VAQTMTIYDSDRRRSMDSAAAS